jgi:MFS family permease
MRLGRLSRNVIVLGCVSFCTDVASEMLYPVMPLFLATVLGGTPELLGLVDGVAEGGSSIIRWVVGAMSDRFRRRKPFVVAGYTLSAFSKPLMGLSASVGGWPIFFAGRCADRLGKSIRTSARDALISESTAPPEQGLAFGLHRAMDTAGAVLGPVLVLLILHVRPNVSLQSLFYFALIPGLVSGILALLAVREIQHDPAGLKPPPILQWYPARLWPLIAAAGLFALGNSSDTFLILRANQLGLTFSQVVLAFVFYNVVYALTSTPLGGLSDRIGRKPIIVLGWTLYAAVYLGFSTATSSAWVWLWLPIYGLYQAMTEGVTKPMVSDFVPKSLSCFLCGSRDRGSF